MPIEHDGISCRVPPSPVGLLLAVAILAGGGWFVYAGPAIVGAGLLFVGLLVLLEQFGSRRVRVISSKLLVEDTRWVTGLLIGPRRRRVGWEDVKGIDAKGGRFAVLTSGAPFVATTNAAPADVAALEERVRQAMAKAAAGG